MTNYMFLEPVVLWIHGLETRSHIEDVVRSASGYAVVKNPRGLCAARIRVLEKNFVADHAESLGIKNVEKPFPFVVARGKHEPVVTDIPKKLNRGSSILLLLSTT